MAHFTAESFVQLAVELARQVLALYSLPSLKVSACADRHLDGFSHSFSNHLQGRASELGKSFDFLVEAQVAILFAEMLAGIGYRLQVLELA